MENPESLSPAQRIDSLIDSLPDWKSHIARDVRQTVLAANADIIEEWKWETPVFSIKGNLIALGIFSDHVKINFFKGALLTDGNGQFNAGLEAKQTRAIDYFQGDKVDKTKLGQLILAAVDLNLVKKK